MAVFLIDAVQGGVAVALNQNLKVIARLIETR